MMYVHPFIIGFIVGVIVTIATEVIIVYNVSKKMSDDENNQ